jgi:hypothetical protein
MSIYRKSEKFLFCDPGALARLVPGTQIITNADGAGIIERYNYRIPTGREDAGAVFTDDFLVGTIFRMDTRDIYLRNIVPLNVFDRYGDISHPYERSQWFISTGNQRAYFYIVCPEEDLQITKEEFEAKLKDNNQPFIII